MASAHFLMPNKTKLQGAKLAMKITSKVKKMFGAVTLTGGLLSLVPQQVFASEAVQKTMEHAEEAAEHSAEGGHGEGAAHYGLIFLMFAIVLIAGKIGNYVEKFGQPAVIGELLAGIGLAAAGYFGWNLVDDIANDDTIGFLSSLGALILLFSIGLESNIKEMSKVGLNALLVAIIGVVVPFVSGAFILGPIFYGDESTNAKLFLGAALVATSVGITASVFRSLKIQKTRAAQTVLGAAVIDDILGLIVLAIVSALASGGEVTAGLIAELSLKSFGFLAGALILGSVLADPISKLFKSIHQGIGMKLAVAMGFALVFGFLAEEFGLEPIIGAFAAGLLLDAVHFDYFEEPEAVKDLKELEFKEKKDREAVLRLIKKHKHSHVEDLIGNLGLIFVPIFFVYTGLQIDFASLLEPKLYVIAAIISVVAVFGKLLAGLPAKGGKNEKLLVGMSMVPRGEVGLIFAATGQALGVLTDELFSVIILVVIMTTFVAPPLIKILGQKAVEAKA
jgi:Kef-type K+ transport system membrane component KefB